MVRKQIKLNLKDLGLYRNSKNKQLIIVIPKKKIGKVGKSYQVLDLNLTIDIES